MFFSTITAILHIKDNFIYNNGALGLIDFDRVRVCPIDYEMLIFKTMCGNPSKFASEEDEDREVKVRIFNENKLTDGIIIFIHGGGWVLGSIDSYTNLCNNIS